jgi:hypothetical protein
MSPRRVRVLFPFRLAAAALVLAAVGTDVAVQLRYHSSIINLFSYFTIFSSLTGAGALTAAALERHPGSGLDLARGAATVYLMTTGVVYALLLSGVVHPATPWVDAVQHRVMPALVLLDWLIDPPRRRIRYRVALWWLAPPLVWLGYTLVRGPLAHWYPYPFVDPRGPGYGAVAAACGAIALLILALSLLVAWFGNRLTPSRVPPSRRAGTSRPVGSSR